MLGCLGLALGGILLCTVSLWDLLEVPWILRLKENLDFIGTFLVLYPWLATVGVLAVVLALLMGKFSLNSTTINVLGVELQLWQTENTVNAHVRNFLSKKRAVFVFYPEYDNHYDCINSLYQILTFLGEQLDSFENFSQTENESYVHIEGMIREIGRFLTKYQSDYRRFYELKLREHEDDFISFQDIQREYGKAAEMAADFRKLNRKMEEHARFFHINIAKWTNWYGGEAVRSGVDAGETGIAVETGDTDEIGGTGEIGYIGNTGFTDEDEYGEYADETGDIEIPETGDIEIPGPDGDEKERL